VGFCTIVVVFWPPTTTLLSHDNRFSAVSHALSSSPSVYSLPTLKVVYHRRGYGRLDFAWFPAEGTRSISLMSHARISVEANR
jgi:hypothetical protein